MITHFNPSRRNVLLSGGALVVSFSLAGSLGAAVAQDATAAKSVARGCEILICVSWVTPRCHDRLVRRGTWAGLLTLRRPVRSGLLRYGR